MKQMNFRSQTNQKQIIFNIASNKSFFFEAFINKNVIFKRDFSSTTMKQTKPGVLSEVEKLMAKSKVFDKNLNDLKVMTDKHTLLEAKTKLDNLRNIEWLKQEEFLGKYIPSLNVQDRKVVFDAFGKGERMDVLLKEKIANLNLSKNSSLLDLKESIKYSELTYSNKHITFSKVESILKSSFDKNNIASAEKDVFNILLAKRNEEKQIFFDFKNDHFNIMKVKIDSALKDSTNFKSPAFKSDKLPITDAKPVAETSYQEVSGTKGPIVESSSFTGKPPLSEEVLAVVEELLDFFF